ncbi:MAG: phosphatase [Oscillospiraceae bacterium]|nr:phosphatase [Oscillospiraceae bacterium]
MKPLLADLHMHTLVSGHAYGTIREMAAGAAERNLQLIGITEHGPGVPGTCDPIYYLNFRAAPRELFGVEILYGCEVNICTGGGLSMERRYLDALDYAIAGIHGFCYDNEGPVRNTDSILKCMADPKVRFISHPDDSRYPIDYPALVQGAKEYGVALEVNNSSLCPSSFRPGCLENYRCMLPLCMEYGVPVIVDSDAHDPAAVGNFTLAIKLLNEIGFDEQLILNNDLQKTKAFLLEQT